MVWLYCGCGVSVVCPVFGRRLALVGHHIYLLPLIEIRWAFTSVQWLQSWRGSTVHSRSGSTLELVQLFLQVGGTAAISNRFCFTTIRSLGGNTGNSGGLHARLCHGVFLLRDALQCKARYCVVRLSLTLVNHDHIGGKSCKLIARTISPTPSLFVAQRSSTYSEGNMEKFWGDKRWGGKTWRAGAQKRQYLWNALR